MVVLQLQDASSVESHGSNRAKARSFAKVQSTSGESYYLRTLAVFGRRGRVEHPQVAGRDLFNVGPADLAYVPLTSIPEYKADS
jgi:hypothetical protein